MAESTDTHDPYGPVEVELRNPQIAAFWAWFWPGAGHLYQRRYAKGVLFMVCILTTYFFGLALGGGRVVYASWKKEDRRYAFLAQFCVGLPALPALVQNRLVMKGREPLLGGFMAPPQQPVRPNDEDQLARWHHSLRSRFELGTLYTIVAGLLNVLVIYDAYAGPVFSEREERRDKPPPDDDEDSSEADD